MDNLSGQPSSALSERNSPVADCAKELYHVIQPCREPKELENRKRMRGPLRDLALPKISQSGQCLETTLVVRHESPWETFKKEYEFDLAGMLDVASCRVRPARLVAIRTVQGKDINRRLRLLTDLQHPNVLSSQECYLHAESLFILYNDLQISLDNLVACEAYLNQTQLAAVLAQIIDGLFYLTNLRLDHPHVISSNILITGKGEVKIGAIKQCVEFKDDQPPQYAKPLEVITMELMQKYAKEDNRTGVDDIERWPCDSHATGFLSSIVSEVSIKSLREHPLLTDTRWCKGHLMGLVSFALRSSYTFCSYLA